MRRALTIGAIILLIGTSAGTQVRDVAGDRYKKTNGSWYLVAASGEPWRVRYGRLGLKFSSLSEDSIKTIMSRHGLSMIAAAPDPGGYLRFKYDDGDPLDVLEDVSSIASVSGAYLDTYLKFFGTPDTYLSNQNNITRARVDKAWEIAAGSSSVIVAVIDDGFEVFHEDFVGSNWTNPDEVDNGMDDDGNNLVDDIWGWDFDNGDGDVRPDSVENTHGTPVAGIVCATRGNGKGIAGVAGGYGNGGALLMPIKLNSYMDASDAITYAWKKGADVINMSWGQAGDPTGAVFAAIDSAVAHGAVLFAATGNNGLTGQNFDAFPSTHPNVIAVGSSDENDEWVCLSNYGPHLDVVAPSSSRHCPDPEPYVWTLDNYFGAIGLNPNDPFFQVPADGKYVGRFSGTSAACPFAAGVAALLRSHMPELTSEQVRQRLLSSAIDVDSVGFDWKTGWGRVDAYRTLTEWGTITGDVTWRLEDTADSTRYVSGDLTIAPGATLTIMPGTIIKIANDDDLRGGSDTLRVEINVQGTLIANGTSANPIVFESWHPQATDDWVGVYFDDQSGGGSFDHCEISRAETAIETYVPVTVSDCTFHDCGFAGIVVQDGLSMIEGSMFTDPGVYGIRVVADSAVVRTTTVDNASGTGLQIESGGGALVRGSQFLNSDKGLYHNGGLHSVNIDSSCVFNGNAIGVHFYQTGWGEDIKNSTINSNTSTGVVCDQGRNPAIVGNTIRYNVTGVNCGNYSSPSIRWNTIKNNANGVIAAFDADPDIGTYSGSGNNTIAYSSAKHVRNYTANMIMAQNNWWSMQVADSTNCKPKPGKIYGDLDTEYAKCGEGSQSLLVQIIPTPKTEEAVVTGFTTIIPNPFNPRTTVHYGLASPGRVAIRVYDVAGRFVRELVEGMQVAGNHEAAWDGTDRRGTPVASGIYFVRMAVGRESFTRKMVLLK